MILSRRVALNGVQLDGIHSAVVIRGVDTGVPKESISAVNRMGGAGQRVTTQHWETLDVSVDFAINVPAGQMALRRQIWEDVMAWAIPGGWLTVDHLPDRRMWADKVILPGSGDLWDWTDSFRLTFRAYSVPFWQDVFPSKILQTSYSGGTLSLPIPGAFRTVLDIEFKNTSGSTLNTFSVAVGGYTIGLSGLSCANNSTLKITHGTDGLLKILVELGYLEMPSTLYDDATRDAVAAFQSAIGVEATGEASASLQRYIYSKAAPDASVRFETTGDSYVALQLGNTGDAVTALQRRLWQLGFLKKEDVKDSIGTFNEATRQAVIDVQLKMGYGSADGSAGEEFQSFLFSKYGDLLKEKGRRKR